MPLARLRALLEWLIFVSATLGTAFGGRRAVQGWLYDRMDRRAARRSELAGWSRGGVDTRTVRLAGPGSDPDALVTLVTSSPRPGRPPAPLPRGPRVP